MADIIVAPTRAFSPRSLRLDTLVRLRWLAVGGQALAVLFVGFVLAFPLPTTLCLLLIGLSAGLNLVLRARYPATLRLGQWPAFALLAYDVLQLGVLLFLTGGLENPFAILLLAPVIVSAAALASRPTAALGLLVIAVASVLAVYHWQLPWYPAESERLPLLYVGGVWIALVSACVFTGVYAFRVAEEARQLAKALNATEMVLAREQHLYALDGLAAAAAHELGTPLATIALVAKEMERDFPPGSPHADDVALLRSQSQRCREILGPPDVDVGAGRHASVAPAAVAFDRGGRGGLSRLLGEDRGDAAERQGSATDRHSQSGDRAGPRQSRGERRRLRHRAGDRRQRMERHRGRDHHRRRRARDSPRRSSTASASPTSPPAATPRRARPTMRPGGSVWACSSPRRYWKGPAPPSTSPIGLRPPKALLSA